MGLKGIQFGFKDLLSSVLAGNIVAVQPGGHQTQEILYYSSSKTPGK